MAGVLAELSRFVAEFGASPTLGEMPRRSLADKGIAGPTAAHAIEEVHAPLNLAYLTFTTGSSAFQNIVGVTYAELPARIEAARRVFERAGLVSGDTVVVSYPPLVNVFSAAAFDAYGLRCKFLLRSSREALLAALYEERPAAVVGESSFLRATLVDAARMGALDELPAGLRFLTAGTPLDLELLEEAAKLEKARVYDLYGCQEFGWLAMDGRLLRDDIALLALTDARGSALHEVVVGGLPTGDAFPLAESGHVLDRAGKLITYQRVRRSPESEVTVKATTLAARETAARLARTILRIKARIVRLDPALRTGAPETVLEVRPPEGGAPLTLAGPRLTRCFDDLARAQLAYQQKAKADPAWNKRS